MKIVHKKWFGPSVVVLLLVLALVGGLLFYLNYQENQKIRERAMDLWDELHYALAYGWEYSYWRSDEKCY